MELPDSDDSKVIVITENHLVAKCHVSYVAGQIGSYSVILKDLTAKASDFFMEGKENEARWLRDYVGSINTQLRLLRTEHEHAHAQEYRYADLHEAKTCRDDEGNINC